MLGIKKRSRFVDNFVKRCSTAEWTRWGLSLTLILLAVMPKTNALAARKVEDIGDHTWWSNEADPDYQHASPEAYEAWKDRKFGMRIHWGLYSHLGVDASWPVGRKEGASDEFQRIYYTLYQVWNPVLFNADEWAELAQEAGMKYFVVTAKHCEGFCMWDTDTNVQALRRFPQGRVPSVGQVKEVTINYDVMDTPFKRDVIRELCEAFRKRGMGVGLYYSNWDWNDPNFRWDKNNRSYDPNYGPDTHPDQWKAFIKRQQDQVRELCTRYGKIDQMGLDCGWPEAAYPGLVEIIKMARKLQPDILFRQRGIGPYGDYMTPEHWVPQNGDDKRVQKPWQAIEHFGNRWAWQPDDTYHPKEWILYMLIDCCAKGGNFMLGVSPMADGRFDETTRESLLWVGKWLKVNGEAIYETRPWKWYKERQGVKFTRSKDSKYIYIIVEKDWPGEQFVSERVQVKKDSEIHMLGVDKPLVYRQEAQKLIIELPAAIQDVSRRPCEYAWVFRCELADTIETR